MRVSRPVYEALPYAYILAGVIAVAMSFLWRELGWSGWLAGFGMIAIVMGLVLALRRRDYRIQMRRYGTDFDEDED
jgi:hypothetical protein